MNPVESQQSRLVDGIRRRSLPAVIAALLLCGVGGATVGVTAGCSDRSANQKPQRQAAPPPPTEPEKPAVSLASLKLHPKAQFPEERAPSSQAVAQAVAAFASALASGADERMKSMLDSRDQAVLGSLIESGEWRRQTESIKVVRVSAINEVDAGRFQLGLGIQDTNGAFLSAWEAKGSGDSWTFTGFAAAPRFASNVAELDGVSLTALGLPEAKAPEKKISAPEPPPEESPTPSAGGDSGSPFKKSRY